MYPTTSSDLQDNFALSILPGKNTFLDIGCGHGRHGSNTFILEKLGWTGLLVDIDEQLVNMNKTFRSQPCIAADVTRCDWSKILTSTTYDYLSFDVDDATVQAIKNFPFDKVRFRVATIEHDSYRVGPAARDYIREVLTAHNYLCVAKDVLTSFSAEPFEDWWIDLKTVPVESLKFFSNNKMARDVLYFAK
jgi:SAM-dependent methyltransferase